MMTMSAERTIEKEEEDEGAKWHTMERGYGRVSRSMALPENADDTRIKADFKEGVLTITIPKKEVTMPPGKKRIDIA